MQIDIDPNSMLLWYMSRRTNDINKILQVSRSWNKSYQIYILWHCLFQKYRGSALITPENHSAPSPGWKFDKISFKLFSGKTTKINKLATTYPKSAHYLQYFVTKQCQLRDILIAVIALQWLQQHPSLKN